MAHKNQRMLYATDLSAGAIGAMRYAVNYASRHSARLIVFHVISPRSIACTKILATFFNEGQEHKIRQKKINAALWRMEKLMDKICEKHPHAHDAYMHNVEHLIVHAGKVAEEIVDKAGRWGCALIILGPGRRSLLKRVFSLDISRKVIRRTDIPVHVIK